MDDILGEEIFPPISAIDKSEFDNYIFGDGKWKMKSDGDSEKGCKCTGSITSLICKTSGYVDFSEWQFQFDRLPFL